MRSKRIRYSASLAVLLAAGVASPALSEELTAVLTQFRETVTLSEVSPVRSRTIPPRRAQVLQIVGKGDEIHVPAGAGVGFVCSTDRWVELPENQGQPLTEKLCRSGKQLPPGTYRRLAPAAGRMVHELAEGHDAARNDDGRRR